MMQNFLDNGCDIFIEIHEQITCTRILCFADRASWYDESHPNQQTKQPPTQSEKYQFRIDTASSPDDGHIVARNMGRS